MTVRMQEHAIVRRVLTALNAREKVVVMPARLPSYWEPAVNALSPLLLVETRDFGAVLQ